MPTTSFTAVVLVSLTALVACSSSTGDPGGVQPGSGTGGDPSGGSPGAGNGGGGLATGGAGGVAGTPASGGAGGDPSMGGAAGTGDAGSGGTVSAGGACTNASDQTILNAINVSDAVGGCAQQNLGAEPATRSCIKQGTGLSDPCVDCFDGAVQCGAQNCWSQCIFDSNSPDCISCRQQFCDPAFAACSGLSPT
jgi:hypothetical protein